MKMVKICKNNRLFHSKVLLELTDINTSSTLLFIFFKEVKMVIIVKKSMGVACVFSKIQPKATIIGTLALVIVALSRLPFAERI